MWTIRRTLPSYYYQRGNRVYSWHLMLNIVYENSADRVALWDPRITQTSSSIRVATKLSLKAMDHTPTP